MRTFSSTRACFTIMAIVGGLALAVAACGKKSTGGGHCGDGTYDATTEECDDGNRSSGDGCDEDCVVESGYSCSGSPSVCGVLPCGDGTYDSASEECDDGNTAAGDGCDANCEVEFGYVCTGSPSVCIYDCDDPDGDQYGVGGGCLGGDCNEGDPAINEGAVETCNATDDNCDGQIDELSDVSCYSGAAGTAGVGVCQAGVSFCVNGTLGPCTGELVPGAEACNLADDDCNGQVDDGLPTLSCGVGACAVSVASCDASGNLQQCNPGTPGSERNNCTDGIDNDCNGLVDDCTCINVAPPPFGDDTNGDGTEATPYATIARGIQEAALATTANKVCVAAALQAGNCVWTNYQEDVTMVDGVSVFGGYDRSQTPWLQRSLNVGNNQGCTTEIIGQTGGAPALVFDVSIASPTVLDNMFVSHQNSGASQDATTVLIEGSTGAIVSNSTIFAPHRGSTRNLTVGIHITDDPGSGDTATPLITGSNVNGGGGVTGIAIWSQRSAPMIMGNCHPNDIDPVTNRCFRGCGNGIAIRANRSTTGGGSPNATYSDIGRAIFLDDSPNAVIDQSMVCGGANTDVNAIRIEGDGTGIIITRNDIVVWGALTDAGIYAATCGGASPWIYDNHRIGAEGNWPLGTAIATAIRAEGDCHPLIESNRLIVGGVEGAVQETFGVNCGPDPGTGTPSRCSIISNEEIRGCNSNFPNLAVGVRCEAGSCNSITGNLLIHGNSGIDVAGLQLRGPTAAFVDRNVIRGGCGVTSSIGILAESASARIQNNVIESGSCTAGGAPSSEWYGVYALLSDGVNELDLHSNDILGGGAPGVTCTSRGITFGVNPNGTPPAVGLGVVRNNIIDAGVCSTSYAVEEEAGTADPRIFEFNALWPTTATALYLDENATATLSASAINALTDMQTGSNIDSDPLWTLIASGLYTLDPLSPCRNTGTPAGAPGWDFEGQSRPEGTAPDMGADEVH